MRSFTSLVFHTILGIYDSFTRFFLALSPRYQKKTHRKDDFTVFTVGVKKLLKTHYAF